MAEGRLCRPEHLNLSGDPQNALHFVGSTPWPLSLPLWRKTNFKQNFSQRAPIGARFCLPRSHGADLGARNGVPTRAQRSGSGGERRSKGAGAVFAVRRKRRQADFATTMGRRVSAVQAFLPKAKTLAQRRLCRLEHLNLSGNPQNEKHFVGSTPWPLSLPLWRRTDFKQNLSRRAPLGPAFVCLRAIKQTWGPHNGVPTRAQRSGSGGERRSKGAGAVFAVRRKRRQADFATTRRKGGKIAFKKWVQPPVAPIPRQLGCIFEKNPVC